MEGRHDFWCSYGSMKLICTAAGGGDLGAACESMLASSLDYCQLCECHCRSYLLAAAVAVV
jgi:hypothetical protein